MTKLFMFDALRQATDEEMSKDSSIFVLGEDVGHYGGSYKVTKDLHSKYGDLRVLDTPIAENSFVGMAIGAAITGLRPIVEGMNMSFLLLAFNQISNNAGMLRYTSGGNFKIPIVIRGPGGVGRQLGAEHSQRPGKFYGLQIAAFVFVKFLPNVDVLATVRDRTLMPADNSPLLGTIFVGWHVGNLN